MRTGKHWNLFSAAVLLFLMAACAGQKTKSEIEWITDLDAALKLAQETGKPLMVDFMAVWCPPCQKMEDTTFCHPDVIRKSAAFVTLRIDVDKQGTIADRYGGNAQKYGGIGIPNILFMTGDQTILAHPVGFLAPDRLAALMDSVLSVHP